MSFTSDEQLAELQETYGLTLGQARAMAAKAGVVRHLARDPKRSGRLALKGGTLLHGVYGSPRVSIADVDYADAAVGVASETVNAAEAPLTPAKVAEALTFDEDGLKVKGIEGKWRESDGLVVGESVPFELDDVEPLDVGGRDEQPLNISVSVRNAEVVQGITVARFRAAFIDEPEFEVSALALEEALVEKVISFSMKHFSKHYVDLAIAARDLQGLIDPDIVLSLFTRKLGAEKRRQQERFKNVEQASDLFNRFHDRRELERMIRSWNEVDKQLFLSLDEHELTDPHRVDELVIGYWTPILENLPTEQLLGGET
jgi:hypothetical protein